MTRMFEPLLGRTIKSIHRVTVLEPDNAVELDFIALFELDKGYVEILVQDSNKAVRALPSPESLELWGEYDVVEIRTGLVQQDIVGVPFKVVAVDVAIAKSVSGRWETADGTFGNEYVLGAVLVGEDGGELAIRTFAEELKFESRGSFERYLGSWVDQADVLWIKSEIPDGRSPETPT